MAPTAMYGKDERVLCFHHELLYEAKVLDSRQGDDGFEYKVHYKGWKNTWDDWVPQDRLRKHNEENLDLARMLKREMESARSTTKPPTDKRMSIGKKRPGDSSARGSENLSPAPQVASKKRGRDLETEREEAYHSKPQIEFLIPDTLKSILVDDWENITKNLQLAQVPSSVPANIVLDEWAAYERRRRDHDAGLDIEILDETVTAFKTYFQRALGKLLLYTFERVQYKEIIARTNQAGDELEHKKVGDLYGPEHLLRMLTQMPEFVANTNIDRQSALRLREELSRLAMFLAKTESLRRYFSAPYESPSNAYKAKVQ